MICETLKFHEHTWALRLSLPYSFHPSPSWRTWVEGRVTPASLLEVGPWLFSLRHGHFRLLFTKSSSGNSGWNHLVKDSSTVCDLIGTRGSRSLFLRILYGYETWDCYNHFYPQWLKPAEGNQKEGTAEKTQPLDEATEAIPPLTSSTGNTFPYHLSLFKSRSQSKESQMTFWLSEAPQLSINDLIPQENFNSEGGKLVSLLGKAIASFGYTYWLVYSCIGLTSEK